MFCSQLCDIKYVAYYLVRAVYCNVVYYLQYSSGVLYYCTILSTTSCTVVYHLVYCSLLPGILYLIMYGLSPLESISL